MSFDQAFIFLYPWTVNRNDHFPKSYILGFEMQVFFCTNHYMQKCLARSTYLFNDDEMRFSFSLHISWQNTNGKVCLAICTFSHL